MKTEAKTLFTWWKKGNGKTWKRREQKLVEVMKKGDWKTSKRRHQNFVQVMKKGEQKTWKRKQKLCSSGEKKGDWKTWKRRQELCSSDENSGWENIKRKFCSSDEKRVMKNMKTEAKTLFKGLKKGNGKHENRITWKCSSASSCKLLGKFIWGKKLELEINSFWEVAEIATEGRKFRAWNRDFVAICLVHGFNWSMIYLIE
jgi:hypothetical protein